MFLFIREFSRSSICTPHTRTTGLPTNWATTYRILVVWELLLYCFCSLVRSHLNVIFTTTDFVCAALISTFKPKPPTAQGKQAKPTKSRLATEINFDLLLTRCSLFVDIVSQLLIVAFPAPTVVHHMVQGSTASNTQSTTGTGTWIHNPTTSTVLFVFASGLSSLGSGFIPACQSLALCIVQSRQLLQESSGSVQVNVDGAAGVELLQAENAKPSTDAGIGMLFGALSTLQAVGQMILGVSLSLHFFPAESDDYICSLYSLVCSTEILSLISPKLYLSLVLGSWPPHWSARLWFGVLLRDICGKVVKERNELNGSRKSLSLREVDRGLARTCLGSLLLSNCRGVIARPLTQRILEMVRRLDTRHLYWLRTLYYYYVPLNMVPLCTIFRTYLFQYHRTSLLAPQRLTTSWQPYCSVIGPSARCLSNLAFERRLRRAPSHGQYEHKRYRRSFKFTTFFISFCLSYSSPTLFTSSARANTSLSTAPRCLISIYCVFQKCNTDFKVLLNLRYISRAHRIFWPHFTFEMPTTLMSDNLSLHLKIQPWRTIELEP